MKKRLTAWLLVFCMALSLLPGTAFAAEGGGDDGEITIYYDLNDGGKSPYLLEMKTTPGQEPPINPGAVWQGRPFAGWAGDRAGSKAADISDGAVLYAQWQSGYEVLIAINAGNDSSPTPPDGAYTPYTTDNNGKLKEKDLAKIDESIANFENKNTYTFEGWYVAEEKGEYEKDDLFTKALTTDTVIPINGLKLYGKWEAIYQISFDYGTGSGQSNPPIRTAKGGVLSSMPKTPAYKDDGYDFEAWYILEPPDKELSGADFITVGQLGVPDAASGDYPRGVRIAHEDLSKFSFTEIAKELGSPITLVANWQLPAGIVFLANGGHFGSDINDFKRVIKTDDDGYCIKLPDTDPERLGFAFIGWYPTDSVTTEDLTTKVKIGDHFDKPTTVYAGWEQLLKITIDYGVGDKDPVDLYIKKNTQLDPDDYKKYLEEVMTPGAIPGWTILPEWEVEENGSTTKMEIDAIKGYTFKSDATIRANKKEGYPITFKMPDGTDVVKYTKSTGYLLTNKATAEPDRDQEPADPAFSDTKGTFAGWSTSETGGSILKPVTFGNAPHYGPFTGPQTLYPQWGPPYKIVFDSNSGGNITEDIKTDNQGKIPYAKLPTPTSPTSGQYAGYVFAGWYLDANLTNGPVSITTPACTEPPTLYAKWVEKITQYDIVYYLPDGTEYTPTIAEQRKTKEDGTYPPLPTPPVAAGTTFGGWYTEQNGGTRIESNATVDPKHALGSRIYLYCRLGGSSRINAPQKVPANKPSSVAAANPSANAPTVTALAAPPYEITFNYNFTSSPTALKQDTNASGKLDTLPEIPEEAKRDGYNFVGWFTEPVDGTPITTSTPFIEPTEVYAHWEQTVKFYSTNGHFSDNAPVKQATTVKGKLLAKDRPEDPTRDGYKFVGWYTEREGKGQKIDWTSNDPEFLAPDSLYAHWELVRYAVTFDDRIDGNTDYVAYTDEDGRVTLPAAPSRPGHTFEGWYTAADGGNEVTVATVFDRDTVVYAHWKKDIEITFDHNGGVGGPQVIKVKNGQLEKQPENPKRAGYEFTNWYSAPSGGTVFVDNNLTADATYYANWGEATWTVTWDVNAGVDATNPSKVDPSETVNGYIPKLPQLTRKGYRFKGWAVGDGYTGGNLNKGDTVTTTTPIYADITLEAVWDSLTNPTPPTNPVITFIVDIAPVPDDAAHFTLETNSSHQLEQLPKLVQIGEGTGWSLTKGGATSVTEAEVYNSSTNLYVSVTQTHLITFDWNNAKDGGTSATTTVRTNTEGQIDADKWPDDLAKDKNPGYQFAGWFTEADGGTPVPKLTKFTEPTTIYAHWKGPFTITFDANGGEFPDGTTTKGVETDDDGNLDPLEVAEKVPTPTREGYTKFGGWSLTKDGTEAVEPDAQPYTGAATLYAIWGPPYAIEYDAMGGEVTPTEEQKLSTEDGKFPELPVPTHPRDSFGGWYTTKDYQEGTLVSAGGDCPGAVTLYAKWTREPPYTITFEANNADATMEDPASGQPVATITLKTDDKGVLMQAPPEPTLRGGKFQGWYTKAEEGAGELISDAATRTYTDDMTLYAHWETREFTITFDFNLGAIMSNPLTITTFTTTKGKSLTFLPDTLPQAASGNYKIKGWYRVQNPVEGKDQPVTTSSTFDRDTTLYAQWELAADLPITFKYPNVTFLDAENGNALVTLEVDKDYKMSSVPPGPYKEGQTFSGWFYREPDRPDGEEKQFTKDTEVTGSLRVYPKYVGAGFTITFEPGEESELEPIKVKTTSEGRIPDGEMPSPTWEGHTFTGWFTAAEGGTKINRRTVFTQDTTVYAHWDKDDSSEPGGPDDPGEDKPGPTSPPYTITFNPNGGNLNASTTALTDLNGRLMSLPTPARTGYSFDGWFNGSERITTATVFTANTTIMAQWSTGSGGSGGNGSGDINGYAITVSNTSGGRVSVSTTYAREGDRVTVTVRPYSGYQLDRIEVTNARGYDVDLRDQGSNRYVFYMPASRVTVDAVFMELIANNGNGGNTGNTGSTGGNTGGNTNWNPGGTVTQPSGGASSGMGIFSQPVLNTVPMPYLDVHPSDWYYSSVDYMWQRQLMGGVSNNRFGPQATTSNAMVWTILARLAGVDVTSGASVWYENARSWAVSNRISDGVGPNSAVTREQLATMLWNFKGSPAVGYDLGQFGDRGQISTYQAECALSWAVANNIVTGTANRLNPRGTATRAEVAAMITRFCQNT